TQEKREEDEKEAADEQRRKKREEDEKEAADERRRKKVEEEEEEKKALEEKKKKEEEEFDKWKDLFETADDGAQADEDLEESQGMLQEFIDYIKNKKIAALDEVASEFKLKSQEVVNRVEGLESMGRLTGLLDDRGKFIYITLDEMASVAKWINIQGRITVSDLAVESNRLIDLNPKEVIRDTAPAPEAEAVEA
ncbi:DDRGK domain-containing protein, partial [Baffinella frigidus]